MSGLIAVVDTEATGLDPAVDKVIELAWAFVDIETAKVVSIESRLLWATANRGETVNGIPEALLAKYGDSELRSLALRYAFDAEPIAILAHNAEFDSQWGVFDSAAPWVCTKADWEWPCIESGKKLIEVALAHGVGVVSAHRAYTDVLTLCATLERAHEKVPLAEMLRKAMVPRKKYAALVSYDDREKAKTAGFQWEANLKLWTKRLTSEAAQAMPFKVQPVDVIERHRADEQAGTADEPTFGVSQ